MSLQANGIDRQDNEVQILRSARNNGAVLKHKLLELRSIVPFDRIFIFEGDDDKIVYHSWIRRCANDIEYEPFVCQGKRKVLELYDILKRDKGNLIDGVYFFVDRDFDDLQGRPTDPHIFMTERFSLENYIVDCTTLKEILTCDLHCHAVPIVRERILETFSMMLSDFSDAAKEANRRIYIGVKLGISVRITQKDHKKIADIKLDHIVRSNTPCEEWILYDGQAAPEIPDQIITEFDDLNPMHRHRGKFFFEFFRSFIQNLANDYERDDSLFFNGMNRTSKVRRNEFTLGSMAIKSPIPDSLNTFIQATVPKPYEAG